MGCTIFYNGKLKNEYTFKDIVSIVQKHTETFDCVLDINGSKVAINFCNGKSEPLVLTLQDNKIDGFCKWNGDNEEEYYKILDMFINLKPLFKPYKIEDDFGIWNSYLIRNKPCKIIKRSVLTEQEQRLLQRIIDNTQKGYSDVEIELLDTMYRRTEVSPFSKNICRLIVQDFLELFSIRSLTYEKRNEIIKVANKISEVNQYLSLTEANFTVEFIYIVVTIWVSYYLSYKNKGIVKDLSNEIRGFESSKLAALFGIVSNFLNCHSGTINPKHAEIDKFILKFVSHNNPFMLSQLGAEREIELLISILDYLGFKYEGRPQT